MGSGCETRHTAFCVAEFIMFRDTGQESHQALSRRSLFGSISLVLVARATTLDSDNVETLSEVEGESCVYIGAVKHSPVH